MKIIKIGIIIFLIMITLSACTRTVTNEDYKVNCEIYGKIIDKMFIAHTDYEENMVVDFKNEIVERHLPDRWYFRLERKDENTTDVLRTDILVSEEEWNQYNIGDYYGGE